MSFNLHVFLGMTETGRGEPKRRFSAGVWMLAALITALSLSFASTPSRAETRRAFLIGIERYSDGFIQRLDRTVNDAKDLAKDLEEVGFDKKNIKAVADLKNRDAFEKEFSAFLKTIETGDTVFFFFSGHGFGVEADQTNYLLFTDLRSPFNFTKTQLSDQERKNADVVRLNIPKFLDAYQQSEIPNGISASEIQRRLAERNPKTVIMVLDACRSLVAADLSDAQDSKPIKRGNDSGSRLLTVRQPPPGFLVLYSASFGEQAVEKLGVYDTGRNSLFTDVLRSELQRPGQSLVELADRVKLAGALDRQCERDPAGAGIRLQQAERRRRFPGRLDRSRTVSDGAGQVRRRVRGLGADQEAAEARPARSPSPAVRWLRHGRAGATRALRIGPDLG